MRIAYRFTFGILLIGLLATITGNVLAQISIDGTGTLTAQGSGRTKVVGNGIIDLGGNGILWIIDRASDAMLEVTGTGNRSEHVIHGFPAIRYAGFNGTAHIEDSDLVVILPGVEIELAATGTGTVHLRGRRMYTIGDRSGVCVWRGFNRSDTIHDERRVTGLSGVLAVQEYPKLI